MKIGTKVVVQRDEKKYLSRGTWPRFRGKKGTVTGTSQGEIGVVFCADNAFTPNRRADAWFLRHELRERK